MTSPDGTSFEASPKDASLDGNEGVLLSNEPAGPGQRRVALAFLLLSALIFLAVAPFATVPLAPMPGFIAIYETALVVTDLITAVFLFSQVNAVRSRAILVLANGYLFTASLAIAHALSFPGLFSATGLLGAGPQTTAWLYMFWHAGFPLFVIAYVELDRRAQGTEHPPGVDSSTLLVSVGAVLFVAYALVLLATQGHDALPVIMQANHYAPAMLVVQLSIWLLSPLALVLLWRRRPHSVLSLWLMVVMCAWFFDVTLSAVINAGRFDLGFYAGRVYGLVASSFVLAMLMLETSKLYVRLITAHDNERRRAAELAALDPLTGIANRRAFEDALEHEWRRMRRHRIPLCLLMIDVDYFKRFNDAYGHVAGDRCLQAIARVLADNARRAGQMAARYGGEEFALLLPHLAIDEAHRLAQRICQAVRDLTIPHKESTAAVHVTVSVGVASALLVLGSEPEAMRVPRDGAPNKERGLGPKLLVEKADQALYVAKNTGRNRVVSATLDTVRASKAHSAA